ncbi:hypothetical protein H2O64_05865 [Kordia sp. YSTF-M3]|uniref:Uncharacterized protein n=1 Tax=Kordia aestuariivivens TaxID=2759037 RepID=A0ABR7Q787_9FLAO|nr:hypothetical protein [Kordia aestuariivivens]MBC8754189.1 hypothetical protein [Kordia aestuariivivens]
MIRGLLLVLLLFLIGCKKEQKVQLVDPNTIEQGPILNKTLTDKQIEQITYLFETFKEVDPTPKEKWIENFKRDLNPDNEIAIWMMMANAYTSFCKDKTISLATKNEVFKLVLIRSSLPENEVLQEIDLSYLSEDDAKSILAAYTLDAKPITIYKASDLK